MNPLRSVGARLSLGLGVVLAAALGLVDLIVVPSLERNLVNAKLAQLREAAPAVAEQISPLQTYNLDPQLQAAAASANARVSILYKLDANRFLNYADSNLGQVGDMGGDPVALRVAQSLAEASGTVERAGERYAEAAVPLPEEGFVVLLSASLHDSLANVDLVRRRLLIAGLIALCGSVLVGYGAAMFFARRLRRLERAADRIAGGDFAEPVVDGGRDEIGQLAGAFERMRDRLAGLERARREFIANASHELRTPIFALAGFLELLENEELDPRTQQEFLETMRGQVDRLTKLATDLLDLSRVDAGRMHVESEPVDLDAVARTLAGEFRALAAKSGHRLVVDEGAATALSDEERTIQIGRILVENALVHTPAGTRVRVRTEQRNGSALLTVEDDGPGITAAHAPHVFDRFYRIDGGTASGSGLGLAIARELATLMRGTIELRSRGQGTTFALILPGDQSPEPGPNGPVFSGGNASPSDAAHRARV